MEPVSLAPGFSRVFGAGAKEELFQQFVRRVKPLKRLEQDRRPSITRLKPGANENGHRYHCGVSQRLHQPGPDFR